MNKASASGGKSLSRRIIVADTLRLLRGLFTGNAKVKAARGEDAADARRKRRWPGEIMYIIVSLSFGYEK